MAKLTYLSHSAFRLETGDHRLIFDPFLTGNPLAPVSADAVECDFIVLTHGHGDHVGDTVSIAKRNQATVIANFEIATWLGKQGVKAHPLSIGGGHDFPFGRVKLTIAHHGSGLETEDGILYLGCPAGALVTVEGKTLYHAGDTALFLDMKLIGEMNAIDLALLPIGDNFTMGVDDAVKATEFLRPKKVVPMHYDTFDVIKSDPKAFVSKVRAIGFQAEILPVGGELTF